MPSPIIGASLGTKHRHMDTVEVDTPRISAHQSHQFYFEDDFLYTETILQQQPPVQAGERQQRLHRSCFGKCCDALEHCMRHEPSATTQCRRVATVQVVQYVEIHRWHHSATMWTLFLSPLTIGDNELRRCDFYTEGGEALSGALTHALWLSAWGHVESSTPTDDYDICCICLEEWGESAGIEVATTPCCGKMMHKACITDWCSRQPSCKSSNCPWCRRCITLGKRCHAEESLPVGRTNYIEEHMSIDVEDCSC